MRMCPGLTLVEVLVLIALLGVVAVGVGGHRGHGSLVDASRSVARHVIAARFAATVHGRFTCIVDLDLVRYVSAMPGRGLAFTPDGLPRTCDGGGVGNTTILLEHRGRQAAVIVSSLGRVRWELR